MRSKKKAAPSTHTEGDGNGQQLRLGGFDNLSSAYSITAFCLKQGSGAVILAKGWGNAPTIREISRISGLSPRDVTRPSVTKGGTVRRSCPILEQNSGWRKLLRIRAGVLLHFIDVPVKSGRRRRLWSRSRRSIMMETYRVLVFEGDIDAITDPYSPALTFEVISWDEAVDLCRLSFSLGYGAVIWQNKEVDTDG